MQPIQWCVITISFFLLSSSLPVLCSAKTVPILAVLSQIKGKVKAGTAKKMTEGINGKMLLRRHRVWTEKRGRATIFFYDGSEVRLFGATELTIGAKKSRSSRWVRYRLVLHSGSFWGHFVRGKNPVEIEGGGIRLQLSNASLRFSKKKTGIDISVPSGMAKVFNKGSSVKLLAGQRLYQIRQNEFLPQKVSLIPNQLKLRIEPSAPIFSGKESLKLNLHFQVVRFGTDHPVDRPGPVHLKGNYYNLMIPDSIRLNTDGKASTIIEAALPRTDDRTFEGTVTFHAIMDQSGYDDVQDGLLKVKLTNP